MAQYKVIQDIEAEDKLLGPLSLRQFIYAAITIALGFVAFRLFISSAWFLGFVFLPPALFFGLLAAPLGGQQSSEIWLLAKIRFFLKPRRRIWDQFGISDLVTITVPKKIEKQLTKGYDQTEVKSRLKTLASTMDTRGWAVKNATINAYTPHIGGANDRLLDISEDQSNTVASDPIADVFDPDSSPRAQALDKMINQSTAKYKDTVRKNIQTNPRNTDHISATSITEPPKPNQNFTITEQDEQNLLNKIHKDQAKPDEFGSHMRVVNPLEKRQVEDTKQREQPVTARHDPDILNIVKNSEGLSVQTIAHQANREKNKQSDDEVVISLH